jgi:hypothetical protein
MGRIEELHLAQMICNAFLITAPLSSYAFWMGYLMPMVRIRILTFLNLLIFCHGGISF